MKQCWYCEQPNDQIADDFIGDFNCRRCGTQNTVLNPQDVDHLKEYQSNQTTKSEWLNDPFDLVDNEPQNEEEDMPFEKQEKNFLSLPKVGQEYDFSQHGKITEIKKVEGQKGFNFVKKESLILPDGTTAKIDKDLGYHYAIHFEDGKILTVSSWKPYYAMDGAGLIEGCKFQLKHLVKGEWECILI